jgi:pimeloyl-ACP methyl ester carboxylesterase
MPTISYDHFNIDYLDVGKGPVVVLIHGAASNNKQWRTIIEDYQDQYRFLAINLFGYGETSPWPDDVSQTIEDQVALIDALCALISGPVCLVGHSFGAAVAAYSARALSEKVAGLVLLEPNPFPLLASENRLEAYEEIIGVRDFLQLHGRNGDWDKVGEHFVDYWLGDGAWQSLAPERQQVFISTLPNNVHEWDAVMNVDVGKDVWHSITALTLVVRASETREPIKSICEIFEELCPHWQFQQVSEGGHMAPVTHPDLVNPIIMEFVKTVF